MMSIKRLGNVKYIFAFSVLFVIISIIFVARAFSAEPITIVSNGTSSYEIVIPNNAKDTEMTAATELQTYLKNVSGVMLPIVEESEAQGYSISIGETVFASDNGILLTEEEQWAIKTVNEHIVITGGGDRGTLYGVYHFLEDIIGVRWWNIWEEYVPNNSTIAINSLDLSGKPAFKYRDMYINAPGYVTPNTYILNDPNILQEVTPEHYQFFARNRLNGQMGFAPAEYGGTISHGAPYFAHSAGWYFHKDQYLATNPEYFASVGGVAGEQLCLANADLQSAYAAKVINFINISYQMADDAGLPRPQMFDISQNDVQGGVCPGWAEYNDSTKNIMFVNSVAEKVALVHPEVKLTTLAYMHYIGIPTVAPRENVLIRFADLDKDNLHDMKHVNNATSLELLTKWSEFPSEIMIWEYGIDYQANAPLPSMYVYQNDFQLYRDLGLTGIFIEDENPITRDMWDMKVWMQSKLMENPDADVSALMEDFTNGYYGPAGSYVLEYLNLTRELADGTSQRNDYFTTRNEAFSYFTLKYVAAAQALLDTASALVSNDSVYLQRLNHARSSLDRLIVLKFMDFSKEAFEQNVDLLSVKISRKASAARLVQTLKDQKLLRSEISNTLSLPYTYAADANAEINQYESFANLEDPEYVETVDGVHVYTAADLRLHMVAGYGLSIVEDELSSTKSAVKVNFADLENARRILHETMGSGGTIPVGIYNVNTATDRADTGIKLDLSTPSYSYKMYKIYDSINLSPSDFIHVNHAWVIQKDIDASITSSNDKFDVYASIRFTGPTFGAPGEDAIFIDKLVFVKDTDAQLPEQLADIPVEDIREFTALEYTLYTVHGGLKLVNDADSPTNKAVKISLNQFTDENFKKHHYITADRPMPIGLYDLETTDARNIRLIQPDEIVLNEYSLYKIDSVTFHPKEYMYLFGSWSVQLLLDSALKNDPNQAYDIYISMKVQGLSYGGDAGIEDAIYIDRIFAVKKETVVELSAPVNLTGKAVSDSSIQLEWAQSPASENVAGYNVYRKGVLIGKATTTSYRDAGLSPNTAYSYYVKAYDLLDNESEASLAVDITTHDVPRNNEGPFLPSAPSNQTSISAGKSGEVSLGKQIVISIPAGATAADLLISITEVTAAQQYLSGNETLISSVYEVLKNRSGNFKLPVTISMEFKQELLKENQKPSIFFYDEVMKSWVEIGGELSGNVVTAKVNHFTKFAVFAVNTEPKDETKTTFKDVASHWAETGIKRAAELGIVNGYVDDTFKPNNGITRAEFVVMLMKILNAPEQAATTSFSDLKDTLWAEKAILQAAQLGIVSGYTDGSFRPNQLITRAQMAVIIAKALKVKQVEKAASIRFTDEDVIPMWAKLAIQKVADAGIMTGRSQEFFVPQGTATRAEAVVVLLRLMDINTK